MNIFWFFEITPLYGLKVSFLSNVFIALCVPHNHLIHLIEIQFSDSAWNILTRSNEIRCDENYTKSKNRSLSFRIDERATLWYVEMRTAERERETRIKCDTNSIFWIFLTGRVKIFPDEICWTWAKWFHANFCVFLPDQNMSGDNKQKWPITLAFASIYNCRCGLFRAIIELINADFIASVESLKP